MAPESDIQSLGRTDQEKMIEDKLFRKLGDRHREILQPYDTSHSTEDRPKTDSLGLRREASSTSFQSQTFSSHGLPVPDVALWKHFNTELGVFRPFNVVDNSFECVYANTNSLGHLLHVLSRHRFSDKEPRDFVTETIDSNILVVSEDFLDVLEAPWTDKERGRPKSQSQLPTMVVALAFTVRFSKEWRMTGHLTCLVLTPLTFSLYISPQDDDFIRAFDIFHNGPPLMQFDVEKLVAY
jgi:hypothetical protein